MMEAKPEKEDAAEKEEMAEGKVGEINSTATWVVKSNQGNVPLRFSKLAENTNLHQPPSNWLKSGSHIDARNTWVRGGLGKFSSFAMAHQRPEKVGEVDVISASENIKKLLKIPFSSNQVSMAVHRVENTLLLDELDILKELRNTSETGRDWVKDFLLSMVLQDGQTLTTERKTTQMLQKQNLLSKFLCYSVGDQEAANADSDSDPDRSLVAVMPQEMHQEESEDFARQVLWQFEDICMLIGSDLPIFGEGKYPAVSLRLREMTNPINVLTGMDYWLDNLMCNVPELVMCYHLNGIVQRYEMLKTEEIPLLEDAKFSPTVVKDIAQNILSFLKSNCTKEGHTYWLYRGNDDDIVKLYDLTSLCDTYTDCPWDNPFIVPVARLLYRVAKNMSAKNPTEKQNAVITKLLKECVRLLKESGDSHPEISSSAYYLLTRIHIQDAYETPRRGSAGGKGALSPTNSIEDDGDEDIGVPTTVEGSQLVDPDWVPKQVAKGRKKSPKRREVTAGSDEVVLEYITQTLKYIHSTPLANSSIPLPSPEQVRRQEQEGDLREKSSSSESSELSDKQEGSSDKLLGGPQGDHSETKFALVPCELFPQKPGSGVPVGFETAESVENARDEGDELHDGSADSVGNRTNSIDPNRSLGRIGQSGDTSSVTDAPGVKKESDKTGTRDVDRTMATKDAERTRDTESARRGSSTSNMEKNRTCTPEKGDRSMATENEDRTRCAGKSDRTGAMKNVDSAETTEDIGKTGVTERVSQTVTAENVDSIDGTHSESTGGIARSDRHKEEGVGMLHQSFQQDLKPSALPSPGNSVTLAGSPLRDQLSTEESGDQRGIRLEPFPADSWQMEVQLSLLSQAAQVYFHLAEEQSLKQSYGRALLYSRIGLLCDAIRSEYTPQDPAVVDQKPLGHRFWMICGDALLLMMGDPSRFEEHERSLAGIEENHEYILRAAENVIGTQVIDWDIELSSSRDHGLRSSIQCYTRALQKDLNQSPNFLVTIARKIGNAKNELGVLLMSNATECLKKRQGDSVTQEESELWKQSLSCFENGIEAFEEVSDKTNSALLLCNCGRLMRLCAQSHAGEGSAGIQGQVSAAEKHCYTQAFKYYDQALTRLRRRRENPQIWDAVSWELCTSHYNLGCLLQDHPPLNTMDREQVEKEVQDCFNKSLRLCDSEDRNPSSLPLYQYRIASIHHRLASMYHNMYRTLTSPQKQRRIHGLLEIHYDKAYKFFVGQERYFEVLRILLERVAVLEYQLTSQTAHGMRAKSFQSILKILVSSIDALVVIQKRCQASRSRDSARQSVGRIHQVDSTNDEALDSDEEKDVATLVPLVETRIKANLLAVMKLLSGGKKSNNPKLPHYKKIYAEFLASTHPTSATDLITSERIQTILEILRKLELLIGAHPLA